MRIAIPQYQDTVSGAYELSQTVSLHDIDFRNQSIAAGGTLVFPKVEDSFGWLVENHVQAVLVGTIDPDNADLLAEKGIHVFTGADDLTPSETAGHFMKLMGEALKRRQSASGGGCCGGHGESAQDGHECCKGTGHDDGSECCGGKGHGEAEGEARECCGKHEHG